MTEINRLVSLNFAALFFLLATILVSEGPTTANAQQQAKAKNPVYTVSNFEVWAEAKDAVAAKKAALEDGKVVALTQLLKRLTLYSSYAKLPKMDSAAVSKMITSLSVQNERNSATEYLANMSFRFDEKVIKNLMRQHNLAYWDRQGPQLIVVPVVDASLLETRGAEKQAMNQRDWGLSWKTLDLSQALVPIKIEERLALIDDAVLSALIKGDVAAKKGLKKAYGGKAVVIALLSSAQSNKKVRLSIIGHDSVGEISYKRDHILSERNYIQAADLAAEVAQGMFEQRLKLLHVQPQTAMRAPPVEVLPWQTQTQEDAPVTGWQGEVDGSRILMHVKFSGLRHWQSIRQRLVKIHGLEDLNIEKLSARSAEISCVFPGGALAFAKEVTTKGMSLHPNGETWVLVEN